MKTKLNKHDTGIEMKRNHFPDFSTLLRNQFDHGGNKYALAENKEFTDAICECFPGDSGVDWILGTCMKYLGRYKNFGREKDLLKVATYMYLLWLKAGFHLKINHDEDTFDNIEMTGKHACLYPQAPEEVKSAAIDRALHTYFNEIDKTSDPALSDKPCECHKASCGPDTINPPCHDPEFFKDNLEPSSFESGIRLVSRQPSPATKADDKLPQGPALKTCPFCGFIAELETLNSGTYTHFMVKCTNGGCGCQTDMSENREFAIAAWNNRATLI